MKLDFDKLRANEKDEGWYYIDDEEYFELLLAVVLLHGAKSYKTTGYHAYDINIDVETLLYKRTGDINKDRDELLVWQVNSMLWQEVISKEIIKEVDY